MSGFFRPAQTIVLASSVDAIAHTGTTNETTIATVTIPANALLAGDRLRIQSYWSYTNGANDKVIRVKFGGTTIYAATQTTTAAVRDEREILIRGASSQLAQAGTTGGFGAFSSAPSSLSIDGTAAIAITFTGALEVDSENITLESYLVTLIRP